MDTTQTKRKELEERMVQIILAEIEKNTLTIDQAKEITTFWLSKSSTLSTEEELMSFVNDSADKWPIFSQMALAQQTEPLKEKEVKIADDVVSLVRDGRIEEAVSLAKAANN